MSGAAFKVGDRAYWVPDYFWDVDRVRVESAIVQSVAASGRVATSVRNGRPIYNRRAYFATYAEARSALIGLLEREADHKRERLAEAEELAAAARALPETEAP